MTSGTIDGVNEMILADQEIDGEMRKLLTHFDRNGFAYTMDRVTGELLVAEKYDPVVNWTTGVDMDPNPTPTAVRRWCRILDRARTARTSTPPASARRRSAPRTSSRRPSRPRPACSTCRPTTSAWTTSRSASATPPASPMSARRCRCTRRRTAMAAWATSSPGMRRGRDRLVAARAVLGVVGRSGDRRRRRVLRHAGRLSEGGRRQDGRGAVQASRPRRASSATS
jgi:hypothetical protein